MPYMSNASRSYQLAEGNTPTALGTGEASSVSVCHPDAVIERQLSR